MRTSIAPELVDFVSIANRNLQKAVDSLLTTQFKTPESWSHTSEVKIILEGEPTLYQKIEVIVRIGSTTKERPEWENKGVFTSDTSAMIFIDGCLHTLENYLAEWFPTHEEPKN